MKSPKKNNTLSTKWRAYGTGLTLSRLCRWLGLAIAVKLAVFFSLAGNFNGLIPGETVKAESEVAGNGIVSLASLPGLNQAQAQGADSGATPPPLPMANATAPQNSGAALPPPGAPGGSGQSDSMLRESLDRRQADLDRREAELNRLEQGLNEKLLNMQAMEARIQTMLKEAQTLKDDKMRHLVDVYTNMKAQQAAQVLETLDERTAVQILAGMRGRQAGEILTYVKPEKAARLSEMLTRMQLPFQN